ncbi:hypothetical protein [Rhodovulum euryhalinum]|uniref:Uncharacterized protein n=1 Tax=Rhodovulum euryhalinum TaxID=35805 RepID=A0A4R2KDL1_9RHOB|nr:hypothetical protein [Rhodovulum euryhalinum]TCO70237.1 hypothetical protein EV655_1101 [Rhodovulum euryhalinum]
MNIPSQQMTPDELTSTLSRRFVELYLDAVENADFAIATHAWFDSDVERQFGQARVYLDTDTAWIFVERGDSGRAEIVIFDSDGEVFRQDIAELHPKAAAEIEAFLS